MDAGLPSDVQADVPSSNASQNSGQISPINMTNMLNTSKCHACGTMPVGGPKQLRKCAGCSIALYCGKECQKNAWPSHKLICRQTSSTRSFHRALAEASKPQDGHAEDIMEVPISGVAGFTTFRSMHGWAIRTMSLACLHLMHEGRGAEYFRQAPVVMLFMVSPAKKNPPNVRSRPWNSWTLRHWRHRPLQEFLAEGGTHAEKWQEAQDGYAGEIEEERAALGDRYLGSLSVMFYVEATNTMLITQYPVAALRDPDALRSPHARGALQDLVHLCLGYVNRGVPLQRFGLDDPWAFPARIVRHLREWCWLPLGTKEQPFDNTWREIFDIVGRNSDLHPVDLMEFASRLW
ncbi:hypothetical protein C8Q76DRAFT_425260 [Earliella scabrosa]|nr:hypothetical protein C8Q76DRAFT_425260 [Earliella scabrosa]